jgi:hypothetical protein
VSPGRLDLVEKNHRVSSPWLVPIAYGAVGVLAGVHTEFGPSMSENVKLVLGGVTFLAVVYAGWGVLWNLRQSAITINAASGPWTRLIALPFAITLLSMLTGVLVRFSGPTTGLLVLEVSYLGALGWYALSLFQATSSFDRACAGRQLTHDSDEALPAFLSHAQLK